MITAYASEHEKLSYLLEITAANLADIDIKPNTIGFNILKYNSFNGLLIFMMLLCGRMVFSGLLKILLILIALHPFFDNLFAHEEY